MRNKYSRRPPFADPVVTRVEWMSFVEVADRLADTMTSEMTKRDRQLAILEMLGQGIVAGMFTSDGRHMATFFPPEECFYGQDFEFSPDDYQRFEGNKSEQIWHLQHIWAPIKIIESWATANKFELWSNSDNIDKIYNEKQLAHEKKHQTNCKGYAALDAPLLEKMHMMIKNKQAISPEDAARAVYTEAAGNGNDDSKIKRLAKKYREKFF